MERVNVFENIERIMARKGVRWADIARRCNTTRQAMYKARDVNNPRLSTLFRIADALHVHVAEFFVTP